MKTGFIVCVFLVCTLLSGAKGLEQSSPKIDPVLECQICEILVGVVEQVVPKGETPDDVVKTLEKLCASLPSYQVECKLIVDTYGRKIITEIINKAPPQNVCRDLTLCPKNMTSFSAPLTMTKELKEPVISKPIINEPTGKKEKSPKGEIECEICQFVIGEIEKYIQENATVAQITAAVEQVCNLVPKAYSGICKAFIDQYAQQVIQGLVNKYTPSQICKQIGVCKKSKIVQGPSPIECAACKYFLTELEKYISSNASVSEIISKVEKFCSVLPLSINATCVAFIEQYGAMVITYLVNKYPPDQICIAMGICSKVQQLIEPVIKPPSEKPNDLKCAVCELVITEIDKLVGNNATEQQIIAAVEKVCTYIPKAYADICKAFIDQYGPEIIQLLLNKYTPDQVCQKIGLCKSEKINHANIIVNDDIYCAACKYILTEIDKYLADNATEKEITAVVEHVCNLLPLKVQNVCDEFVEEYGPMVLNLLANKLPPNKVCTSLKLCKSKPRLRLASKVSVH